MSRAPGRPRVVFDCNVCIQSMAFDDGAAAQSIRLMDSGSIEVFVSRATLGELRRVSQYPEVLTISSHMTPVRLGALLTRLHYRAFLIKRVPKSFEFPRDPNDEPYLNLAYAVKA